MKEIPILMSGPMVKQYLLGRKSMTRRLVDKNNSVCGEGRVDWAKFCWDGSEVSLDGASVGDGGIRGRHAPLPFVDGKSNNFGEYLHVPYDWAEDETVFRIYSRYEFGDVLWWKEAWAVNSARAGAIAVVYKAMVNASQVCMLVGVDDETLKKYRDPKYHSWQPSLFMPRWASRIVTPITAVRCSKLEDITLAEAIAEGFASVGESLAYVRQLNPKMTGDPWMWDISFPKKGGG